MKIGVFDSGYGGLTILRHLREQLPQYDYIYLGDNARAPYGTRSFDIIYEYTLQAVRFLKQRGCRLIILACNTASAKALRSIQQRDIDPSEIRVLGVIRPTVEAVPMITKNRHIGVLATQGTVSSESYLIELQKQFAGQPVCISQQACPLWVPLVESGESSAEGADYFVHKYMDELLAKDPETDTIVLGCTHYPLLLPKIEKYLSEKEAEIGHRVEVISQGTIVARSLEDYLRRHTEIERLLSLHSSCQYLTTESATKFADLASIFLSSSDLAQSKIEVSHVEYC